MEEIKGCKNLCGDGVCQKIVCMAIGCPCPETKESCPQDCKESLDASIWQTYRNEEVGVEFKYPSVYEYRTWITDTKDPEQVGYCPGCEGKKIEIVFYPRENKENPSFNFIAATEDYALFMDRYFFAGSPSLDFLCPGKFSSNPELCKISPAGREESTGLCKIIKINNIDAVFQTSYWLSSSGLPYSLATEVLFNNKSNSIYKGLSFFSI